MKEYFKIAAVLFLFPVLLFAQPGITLKGKVIDQENNEGIAFVSVGIEGTFLGAATNTDGFFELKVPEDQQGKTLYFSAIGYKNVSLSISELIRSQDIVVNLIPQAYNIEAVDVAAESKVLQRILRTAAERIPNNYISKPMNLKIYFREKKSNDIKAGQTIQAMVNLYDANGYAKPSWTDAYKSRSYKITESQADLPVVTFRDASIDLDEMLESDIARLVNTILNPKLLNDYKLKMEAKSRFNNDSVWIISYESSKLDLAHTGSYYPTSFKGKIYIALKNYSVLRNEVNLTESKANPQGRSLAAKSNAINTIQRNTVVGYKQIDNRYVLAFVDCEKQYQTDKKQSVYESGKLVVSDTETQNPSPLKGRDYFLELKPNEKFWQSFSAPSY